MGLWPSHPRSHGTVSARSADPYSPPPIRLNFLSDDENCRIVAECVRKSRAIFSNRAATPYSVKAISLDPDVTTDDEVIEPARAATVGWAITSQVTAAHGWR